jgi:FecR protein
MKTKIALSFWIAGCCALARSATLPLTQSIFTEIINEANVVAAATETVTPARTNEMFRVPDLVRTGPDSRVELTAADQTITRVGANTVFTFARTGRNITLERGSVLFHAPAGRGGGTITSGGASASVLGTTVICAVMSDGRFKTIVLEGKCKVTTLWNNKSVTLHAGQMVIVSRTPGGKEFGTVETVDLKQLVKRLLLVFGFSRPLSSLPLIEAAIQQQQQEIANGTAGPFPSLLIVSVGFDLIGGNYAVPERLNAQVHTSIFLSPVH